MNTLRDWGISQLRDVQNEQNQIMYSGYCILYTTTDHIHLRICDEELHLKPETFFFIPPNCAVSLLGESSNAILIWFKIDLFVDRLEFLSHIKRGIFFKNSSGFQVENTFMPYHLIVKHYYLPSQNGIINKLFAKNLLINFIEFILLRTLLEHDPKLHEYRQNSYEKEIANRFVFLIHHEPTVNFRIDHYADQLNITKRTLDNAIQTMYGCSTKRFIIAKALEKTKKLLRGTEIPIKNISQEVGFSEESNFSNFFKKHTGHSPREYREHAAGNIPNLRITVD